MGSSRIELFGKDEGCGRSSRVAVKCGGGRRERWGFQGRASFRRELSGDRNPRFRRVEKGEVWRDSHQN